MNKTEAAYAGYLETLRHAGEIQWFKFECVTLKLADNTRYTPDFLILAADNTLEAHEVKGFWQGDARVKIKVAAELFPFKFIAVKVKPKKLGGGWEIEQF